MGESFARQVCNLFLCAVALDTALAARTLAFGEILPQQGFNRQLWLFCLIAILDATGRMEGRLIRVHGERHGCLVGDTADRGCYVRDPAQSKQYLRFTLVAIHHSLDFDPADTKAHSYWSSDAGAHAMDCVSRFHFRSGQVGFAGQ